MFNEKNIKTLENIYERIETTKERLTHEYSIALENTKDNDFDIERKGVKSTVTGATLWYEVQNLGKNCEAALLLKPLYPLVFELAEEHDVLVRELETFSTTELHINPTAITLLDIVRIVKSVIKNK